METSSRKFPKSRRRTGTLEINLETTRGGYHQEAFYAPEGSPAPFEKRAALQNSRSCSRPHRRCEPPDRAATRAPEGGLRRIGGRGSRDVSRRRYRHSVECAPTVCHSGLDLRALTCARSRRSCGQFPRRVGPKSCATPLGVTSWQVEGVPRSRHFKRIPPLVRRPRTEDDSVGSDKRWRPEGCALLEKRRIALFDRLPTRRLDT